MIKRNLFYQVTYQVISLIFPLITTPYVSRVLGVTGLGEYTYTFTVVYYFSIFCMLGLETHGQRIIAYCKDNIKERSFRFWNIYITQLILCSIVLVAYFIYFLFFSSDYKLLTLIQSFYLLSCFMNITWFYQGIEEFKKIVIRNIVIKIISIVMIFVLVRNQNDLWIYALIMVVSTLLGNSVFLLGLSKYINLSKIDIKFIKKNIKPILLLFIPQISITLFMQVDKVILGSLGIIEGLGYYQNMEKIINVPVAVILSVGNVMMPRIAALMSEKKNQLIRELNEVSMHLMMVFAIGCLFGILVIAKDFVPWFFGEEYVEAIPILQLMGVIIIFMAWENVIQKQLLIPLGKDKIVIISTLLAAVANMILNVLLIPGYGVMGAIFATIIAHVVLIVYQLLYVKNMISIKKYFMNTIPFIGAGLIMFVIVDNVSAININLFPRLLLEIIVGVLIYIILSIFIILKSKSILGKKIKNKLKERIYG